MRYFRVIYPLILFVIMLLAGCASQRYTKKAVKFEQVGLTEDAADYYYEAVKRKDSNIEAKLGLKKNAQLTLDSKLDEVDKAYRQMDYEGVVNHYIDAELYYEKVSSVGVRLIFPDEYNVYYSEAKNDFLSVLYRDGLEKLNREEFDAARKDFEQIIQVDQEYKDVKERLKVASYEPIYRNANAYLENEMYRSAYYEFDRILTGAGNYKQALALKNKAQEKGTIRILVNEFGYVQQSYNREASTLSSGVISQLLGLKNPFLRIIDGKEMEKTLYEKGKINMEAAKLYGIHAVFSGKVLRVETKRGNLKREIKKGYLREITRRKNSEGIEVEEVNYKKTEYTEYYAVNFAKLQVDFSVLSTKDGEVIISDLIKLENSDRINYADFQGDKNSLVPGYWKNKMYQSDQDIIKDNRSDVNALQRLLKASRSIKSVSTLTDELIDESAMKIVKKIDDHNPEK